MLDFDNIGKAHILSPAAGSNAIWVALLRENPEIFDPVLVDSVKVGQKFIAWTSYYSNGQSQAKWGMDT